MNGNNCGIEATRRSMDLEATSSTSRPLNLYFFDLLQVFVMTIGDTVTKCLSKPSVSQHGGDLL